MSVSDAQKRASAKYNREKMTKREVSFSPNEKDILDYLDAQPNKSGFIKQLIHEYMEANKQ